MLLEGCFVVHALQIYRPLIPEVILLEIIRCFLNGLERKVVVRLVLHQRSLRCVARIVSLVVLASRVLRG